MQPYPYHTKCGGTNLCDPANIQLSDPARIQPPVGLLYFTYTGIPPDTQLCPPIPPHPHLQPRLLTTLQHLHELRIPPGGIVIAPASLLHLLQPLPQHTRQSASACTATTASGRHSNAPLSSCCCRGRSLAPTASGIRVSSSRGLRQRCASRHPSCRRCALELAASLQNGGLQLCASKHHAACPATPLGGADYCWPGSRGSGIGCSDSVVGPAGAEERNEGMVFAIKLAIQCDLATSASLSWVWSASHRPAKAPPVGIRN